MNAMKRPDVMYVLNNTLKKAGIASMAGAVNKVA